jgi:hypothetical protein
LLYQLELYQHWQDLDTPRMLTESARTRLSTILLGSLLMKTKTYLFLTLGAIEFVKWKFPVPVSRLLLDQAVVALQTEQVSLLHSFGPLELLQMLRETYMLQSTIIIGFEKLLFQPK